MSNLKKATRALQRIRDARSEQREPAERPDDELTKALANQEMTLLKGRHDAMFHHALHAKAARRGGKPEEAKQHEHMFLRHALENSCGSDDAVGSMRRNVDHYNSESWDKMPWVSNDSKQHPAVKHFKDGGGFVSHAEDKKVHHEGHGGKHAKK